MTILYVDSDNECRKHIPSFLAQVFDRVITANNCDIAIKKCIEHNPEMLITEVDFEDQEVTALLETMDNICPHIKTIIISKDIDFITDVVKADAYVNKPVDPYHLNELIRTVASSDSTPRSLLLKDSTLQELHH